MSTGLKVIYVALPLIVQSIAQPFTAVPLHLTIAHVVFGCYLVYTVAYVSALLVCKSIVDTVVTCIHAAFS